MRRFVRKFASGERTRLSDAVLGPIASGMSRAYGLGVSVHRLLFEKGLLKSNALPVPVISVGNLVWGGTGKTPMVEFLSRHFISTGRKPLVLTRVSADSAPRALLNAGT
jgi:tetraacyldisaccharide 4'-kinase